LHERLAPGLVGSAAWRTSGLVEGAGADEVELLAGGGVAEVVLTGGEGGVCSSGPRASAGDGAHAGRVARSRTAMRIVFPSS
jgi:hypothetical protein